MADAEAVPAATGTSIFDPVLCELAYRWFCPPGGHVLDPFAGGSVRGIVAGKLGRQYTGIELRPEQVTANKDQARAIMRPHEPAPQWIEGDSRLIPALLPEGLMADMVFSCPPYADLELYSDDPRDLSNMPWPDFVAAYRDIVAQAVARLKPDRFAVWVIGDVRDKKGFYRGLPWETVQAFELAGARLYNEAVLVTAVGSLPLRTRKQFESGRKMGKTHQNVFVFCKGNPQKATALIGPVDFGAIPDDAVDDQAPLPDQAARKSANGHVAVSSVDLPDHAPEYTAIEPASLADGSAIWLKRDDTFALAGIAGGKVRSCWSLVNQAPGPVAGLITAGARHSPQVAIVARLAARLGVPCRCHVPAGEPGPELLDAVAHGAELVPHRPGYNSVIVARAHADATDRPGWFEVPFGMECTTAAEQTAGQVYALPNGIKRVVVPVGSGMTLAGVLRGLDRIGMSTLPVLGVQVGADPTKRLDAYAPARWRERVKLVASSLKYEALAPSNALPGVTLDPHYEAKCVPFLRPGDLFWIVGIRATVHA